MLRLASRQTRVEILVDLDVAESVVRHAAAEADRGALGSYEGPGPTLGGHRMGVVRGLLLVVRSQVDATLVGSSAVATSTKVARFRNPSTKTLAVSSRRLATH